MKKVGYVVGTTLLLAACGSPAPAPAPEAAAPAHYANLAQLMQAIPFPASNIIFDAGSEDPEEKKKNTAKGDSGALATSAYGGVYAGWLQVENAALTLSEAATLIMIPGRTCSNGRPVPVEQEDFKKWAAGLADAGRQTLEAAKTKDLDKMLEAGGVVTEACAACHEVYRDTPDQPNDRCIPPGQK